VNGGRRGPIALAALLLIAPAAGAQDFAPAAPAGPTCGALALLERALPAPSGAWSLESAVTRWLGLASLETRACAASGRLGPARIALGLSQTGDPELGWSAAALAVGACEPEAGAALRVLARHDRAAGAIADGQLARGGGVEAGAGAWLAAGEQLTLWAQAPQLRLDGAAPPLVRTLELGARWSGPGLSAWGALAAPRGGGDGVRTLGLELGRGPLALWAEVRDGPLRGSCGVRGAAAGLVLEAAVDAHPVLGETTRLALRWGATRRGGAE
jgi:hypothetical protein